MTSPADPLAAVIAAARRLIEAVTFDECGVHGVGGNGGLLNRETIRRADELRLVIAAAEVIECRRTADPAIVTPSQPDLTP